MSGVRARGGRDFGARVLSGRQEERPWHQGREGRRVLGHCGDRCKISVSCRERHGNDTGNVPWKLALFLRRRLARGDSPRGEHHLAACSQTLPVRGVGHHHGNPQRTQVQDAGNTGSKSIFSVLSCLLARRRAREGTQLTFRAITPSCAPASGGSIPTPGTRRVEAQRDGGERQDEQGLGRLARGSRELPQQWRPASPGLPVGASSSSG